ncbi:MAG TPA: ATP-binding cassette domain-containing protein [Chryseosolibacter sp.]
MNHLLEPPDSETSPLTIAVNDLSKRFNREWIFRELSLEFAAGLTYAITGPNGSGKSTLLQVVWGQVPQTSGTIIYKKGALDVPLEQAFRYVSIAAPYMDLIDEFTLMEMLNFHFKLKKIRSGFSIGQLLQIMYLENAADKQLVNFSSGMRQRLKLGLALYTEADAYFLDEPGTNLDRRAFGWYIDELSKLPKRSIVFIASNEPEEYPQDAVILNLTDYKKK